MVRRLIVVVAILAAVVGCSGGSEDESKDALARTTEKSSSTTKEPTTTVAPTTTTTEAPTTTTAPSPPPSPAVAYVNSGPQLSLLDLESNEETASIEVDPGFSYVSAGADAVWAIQLAGPLLKLDHETLEVIGEFDTPDRNLVALAVGAEVWVTDGTTNQIYRVDPSGNRAVETIDQPFGEDTIVYAEEREGGLDYLVGLDSYGHLGTDRQFATHQLPDPFSGFGARFHDGQVWAPGDDAIGVFDIATGAQVATIPGISADSFAGVAPSDAGMWVRGLDDSLRLVGHTTFQVARTFDTIPGTLLEAAGDELGLKRDDGRGHKAIRVDATTGEEIDAYRPGGPNPVDEIELGD